MAFKVLVLGYFGFATDKKDGQATKTRQCLELLKRNMKTGTRISTFDTEILHTKPWRVACLLWKTIHSNKVVYLPAQNNLYYFFPFLFASSKIFRFDIIYLLIGGWLPFFLEKHPRLVNKLRKIKGILPENEMVTALLKEKFKLKNVYTLPNFRFTKYTPKEFSSKPGEFRLVFMSRIVKEKGIETVFQIADYFNKPEMRKKCAVSIDFYGEISSKDKEFFFRKLPHYGQMIQYKGILSPDEITHTLCTYDALILPTRYPTEGVPGAIIDAYMAGIPVMVSDWIYSRDVVKHEKTGYIIPLDRNEVKTYIHHIEYLSLHPQELLDLKAAARAQSAKYDEKAAWTILKPFLS